MLSKCANPRCSSAFLYLHRGQLFKIETVASLEKGGRMGDREMGGSPGRRFEYFWLCEECAPSMTLTFDKELGVTATPVSRSRKASA
jgi:hypothetical protein